MSSDAVVLIVSPCSPGLGDVKKGMPDSSTPPRCHTAVPAVSTMQAWPHAPRSSHLHASDANASTGSYPRHVRLRNSVIITSPRWSKTARTTRFPCRRCARCWVGLLLLSKNPPLADCRTRACFLRPVPAALGCVQALRGCVELFPSLPRVRTPSGCVRSCASAGRPSASVAVLLDSRRGFPGVSQRIFLAPVTEYAT